jgi:hypothetical protein
MEIKQNLQKVYTIYGEAFIDFSEIIGILPKSSRDGIPCILLRCGERIYIDDYHLQQLKKKIFEIL